MNFKKYLIPLLAFVALGGSSCSDFLEQDNPSKVAYEDSWDTVRDCEDVLTSVYNGFKNVQLYALTDENMRTDIAIQGGTSAKRTNFTNAAYKQDYTDTYGAILNKWSAMYTVIFRANQVLEGVEIVRPKLVTDEDKETLDEIKSQAHLFRGMMYFYLHNQFNKGSVPIFDYVPKGTDDIFMPLSTADEVKAFYRADIIEAINLGIPFDWPLEEKGKLTMGVAQSLMGMSYLYDKDWERARQHFEAVIDSNEYELADILDNVSERGEFNSESILEVSYTLNFNSELTGQSALYHTLGMNIAQTGWSTIVPSFWLVEQAETEPIDPKDSQNLQDLRIDTFDHPIGGGGVAQTSDILYEQLDSYILNDSTVMDTVTGLPTGETVRTDFVIKFEGSYYDSSTVPNYYSYETTNTKDLKLYKRVIKRNAAGTIVDTPKYTLQKSGNTNMEMYFVPYSDIDPVTGATTVRRYMGPDGNYYVIQPRLYSPRAKSYFALIGDIDQMYYMEVAKASSFSHKRTAYFKKYTNFDTREDEDFSTPAQSSAINLRLIRLADIYLLYAEALIEGGTNDANVSKALKYINRVRRRGGAILAGRMEGENSEYPEYTYEYRIHLPYNEDNGEVQQEPITTAQEVMEHLMYVERPLELQLDGIGQRAIDLRRWGVYGDRLRYLSTQRYTTEMYARPSYSPSEKTLYFSTSYEKQMRYTFDPTTVPYADYEDAAVNFTEAKEYWPIPNKEVTSNPYI